VTDILTNDEISLLRSLEKKSRTITGNFTHNRYDRLETKGYIKRSSQSPSMQDMLYEITDAGTAASEGCGWRRGLIRTKTTMHDVDFDLSDSMRALIRNGINIDDRTAVESALSDTAGYTHDPAVFARYVDEVIKTARRYMATGQTD